MKPVTIVGGGLAGLTLGLGLRRRQVPVTVVEAGHYPRHRVCGEFISGSGRAVLEELELEDQLMKAGAREATSAAFFARHLDGAAQSLPQPALCVSRFVLDRVIAGEFQRLGGVLQEGRRWQDGFGEGIVRGTGRRTQSVVRGWRWLGLKVHARSVSMSADLELHLRPGGYVGLCRLNDGEANICGLFRTRSPEPDLARTWRRWLIGPEASALHLRLGGAEFLEDSFCSVAGLMIEPRRAADRAECCIGDALTMIAPLTGNGMSMAFESAAIAVGPLEAYSRGALGWEDARREIGERCDAIFRRRLVWGRCLQAAALHSGLSEALVWIGNRCPGLWRHFFERTR
jgi:2-polyprenyl-6-methoxyphenol hydroxylase-like FAD-dependent oxidoreductase